jgi:hypothetical protein
MKVFMTTTGMVGMVAFAVMATAGAMIAIAQVTMVLKARAEEIEAGNQDTFTKVRLFSQTALPASNDLF